MTRLVIKVGGAVAGDVGGRILGLAEEGHEVVVVHGAGPQITEEMQRRGIPVEFVRAAGARRGPALEVVRESMEAVNAALCAALGELAVPISATTRGLLAVPVPPLGQVGDPLPCRPAKVAAGAAGGEGAGRRAARGRARSTSTPTTRPARSRSASARRASSS